jgi:hypothetical protein
MTKRDLVRHRLFLPRTLGDRPAVPAATQGAGRRRAAGRLTFLPGDGR